MNYEEKKNIDSYKILRKTHLMIYMQNIIGK